VGVLQRQQIKEVGVTALLLHQPLELPVFLIQAGAGAAVLGLLQVIELAETAVQVLSSLLTQHHLHQPQQQQVHQQ
jgi:hypothetical protein